METSFVSSFSQKGLCHFSKYKYMYEACFLNSRLKFGHFCKQGLRNSVQFCLFFLKKLFFAILLHFQCINIGKTNEMRRSIIFARDDLIMPLRRNESCMIDNTGNTVKSFYSPPRNKVQLTHTRIGRCLDPQNEEAEAKQNL